MVETVKNWFGNSEAIWEIMTWAFLDLIGAVRQRAAELEFPLMCS